MNRTAHQSPPGKLNFRKAGSGQPLLILHGLFGSLDNWQNVCKTLSDSFEVYALDLRNHGRSFHSPVHTYPAIVQDLADFAEQRELHDVALLGHSMGGKAAMAYALAYPRQVKKLVVVDISPRAYRVRHDHILESLRTLPLDTLRHRSSADTILAGTIPEQRVRQFLLKNLKRSADGTFSWKMNLDALSSNYREMTKGIHAEGAYPGPALFVRGELSEYIGTGDRALIRRLFPRCRHAVIPGAGHWVHADNPERFVEVVKGFLLEPSPEHP